MRLPILSEEAFNALDRWALLSECKKESEQCCGSGAFLTLDSGSGIDFFSDPGSQIQIFDNLMKNCWVKTSTIILNVLNLKKLFLTVQK
jgi:hypothetical protein